MTTSSPLLSPDPADPSSPANMRRRKSLVRRIERCCSVSLKHFPLLFVYGVTTWAVFTGVRICLVWPVDGWIGRFRRRALTLEHPLTSAQHTRPSSSLSSSMAFSIGPTLLLSSPTRAPRSIHPPPTPRSPSRSAAKTPLHEANTRTSLPPNLLLNALLPLPFPPTECSQPPLLPTKAPSAP